MENNEVTDAMEMLGQGYGHQVADESNDKKYFIITPRIVKAFSRNPYDFALWDTIKDIAGESRECILSTPQLAALSGMSVGQVSKSREYWISIKFLAGQVRRDPGYPQPVWHLTVPDLWQQNIAWCEAHPKIADRINFITERKSTRKKSVHRVKGSPGEKGTTPGELKNTNKKGLGTTTGDVPNVFKLYEKNIGPLTPIIADFLKDAEDTYSATWVALAIQEAAANNVRKMSYINGVLKGYKERGSPDIPREKKEYLKKASKQAANIQALEAVEFDEKGQLIGHS